MVFVNKRQVSYPLGLQQVIVLESIRALAGQSQIDNLQTD